MVVIPGECSGVVDEGSARQEGAGAITAGAADATLRACSDEFSNGDRTPRSRFA